MELSLRVALNANRALIRAALLLAGVFVGYAFIVFPLFLIGTVALVEVVGALSVAGIFFGVWGIAWSHLNNRAGLACALVAILACGYAMWNFFISREIEQVFPLIGAWGWAVVIFFIFTALPLLLNFLAISLEKFYQHLGVRGCFAQFRRQVRAARGRLLAAGVLVVVGGSSLLILALNQAISTINIQPKEYQVKFAFWGSHYHTRYTAAQLDALNRHGVTIAPYTVGSLITSEERSEFVAEMNWWKANYPKVKFLPAVLGIPGAYVWDGSAAGTTALAKEIVQMVHAEGLTNVKGLSFDWEEPVSSTLGGVSSAPNRTRHEESIQIWNDFFDWMEVNAPELMTSNINYVGSSIDSFDLDFDLHYADKFNTFEVPRWDEYAPMIYRCGYKGTKPYGDVPRWPAKIRVDNTYDFYTDLNAHVVGVERMHPGENRTGVYIGITNCTCYGRDVEVWEFGEYLGKGYDVLVRDTLICKHFGLPTVTIFILTTEPENGYSMGGVFDSYGDDFLDRFNASVNGRAAPQPFTIPAGNLKPGSRLLIGASDDYVRDIVYSVWFFPCLVGTCVLVGGLARSAFRQTTENSIKKRNIRAARE